MEQLTPPPMTRGYRDGEIKCGTAQPRAVPTLRAGAESHPASLHHTSLDNKVLHTTAEAATEFTSMMWEVTTPHWGGVRIGTKQVWKALARSEGQTTSQATLQQMT